MKSNTSKTSCKRGFTLIELLIVVLIIGILAAVALPQYQKAVEKSKAVQAMTLLKSVGEAARIYFLENGGYPASFEDLVIEVPPQISDDWAWGSFSTWTNLKRQNGPYAGAGFQFGWNYSNYSEEELPTNQLVCMEWPGNGFSQPAGSYCEKLFHGVRTSYRADQENSTRVYKLP